MTPPDVPDDDEPPGPTGPVVHEEKARSYREVLVVLAALAAGFAFDASLGSAVAHLPGWIAATVLIAGVDALFVASARSTRSLVVTPDELWVGEEAVLREQIAGLSPGAVRDPDVPILGWPSGRPGRTKGVTLRLADGRDVVVPTKRAAELADVLGVTAPAPRARAQIRPATDEDLAEIPDIDARAEIVFRLAGHDLPELPFPADELADAAAVFVVDEPPVGFVWLGEVDGNAYIEEIAVLPGVMRTGLGTALLEHACDWARSAGYPAITLVTYAEVAWNAPFYAAHGFVATDAVTPGLAAIREKEKAAGLDDVGPRIVMSRTLR